MKRRPGVWHGMAKAYAYGVASPLSFSTVDGKTMISSESGADVASMPTISSGRPGAINLRVDEGMGQAKVMVAHVLVIALDIVGVAGIVRAKVAGRGTHGHHA